MIDMPPPVAAASALRLAMYQPDQPQNTGAMLRLCACLGLGLDIIEPCGFVWDDAKLKRVAMDYRVLADPVRHRSWEDFTVQTGGRRIILLTTRGVAHYAHFAYRRGDILLLGRESAGVPDAVHQATHARITIPMASGARSLNVVMAAAIAAGEALRQTIPVIPGHAPGCVFKI